jgi:chromosome segregation ATPase
MALPEKKTSNGWLSQAERLAGMHGTAGTRAIAATELARQQPLLNLVKTSPDFPEPEEPQDTATRELQLTKELELARAKISSFERRMTREKSTADSSKQELERVSEQLDSAEARIADLENQLAAEQNTAARSENETLSLQTSLDLVSAENSRLQAQVRLNVSMLEEANAQTKSLWNEAAASEMKRVAHMKEAERYRTDAEAKEVLIEAAKSRAELAEKLYVDVRERLALRIEEDSLNMRKIAELTDICNDQGEKLDELRVALIAKQLQTDELEKSRHDLATATSALLMTYESHRSAWLQSEARAIAEAPKVTPAASELPAFPTEDVQETGRSKWIELARELAKLRLKRQLPFSAQAIPAPVLLANTINF